MKMKKLTVVILGLLWFLNLWTILAANKCWEFSTNSTNASLGQLMDDCKPGWVMEAKSSAWWIIKVVSNDWYSIENAKWKIYAITQKAVILASILAIWWLVYSWYLFVTAYWDDGKHKKAKEAMKWSLIWLLLAFVSQQLVNAVVNLIYDIWG